MYWSISCIKIMHIWKHFCTITEHKILVMKGCFQVGLYRQGLLHDLSKYSPTEFIVGAKYYQGDRSPNAAEKEEKGYSSAWLHHKGRNKHHYEYWTDTDLANRKSMVPVKMPLHYAVEMFIDRIAASKVYQGKNYTDRSALDYYNRTKDIMLLHPDTKELLEDLLFRLAEKGEKETFSYVKNVLLKNPEIYEGKKNGTDNNPGGR